MSFGYNNCFNQKKNIDRITQQKFATRSLLLLFFILCNWPYQGHNFKLRLSFKLFYLKKTYVGRWCERINQRIGRCRLRTAYIPWSHHISWYVKALWLSSFLAREWHCFELINIHISKNSHHFAFESSAFWIIRFFTNCSYNAIVPRALDLLQSLLYEMNIIFSIPNNCTTSAIL